MKFFTLLLDKKGNLNNFEFDREESEKSSSSYSFKLHLLKFSGK